MSVSSRPLPEDDGMEADILAVTGPESQPGKNLALWFQWNGRLCAIFEHINLSRKKKEYFLFYYTEPKEKLNVLRKHFFNALEI